MRGRRYSVSVVVTLVAVSCGALLHALAHGGAQLPLYKLLLSSADSAVAYLQGVLLAELVDHRSLGVWAVLLLRSTCALPIALVVLWMRPASLAADVAALLHPNTLYLPAAAVVSVVAGALQNVCLLKLLQYASPLSMAVCVTAKHAGSAVFVAFGQLLLYGHTPRIDFVAAVITFGAALMYFVVLKSEHSVDDDASKFL